MANARLETPNFPSANRGRSIFPKPPKRPSNPANEVSMVAAHKSTMDKHVGYWDIMAKYGRVTRVKIATLSRHEEYMQRCAERRKGMVQA